MNVIMQTYLGKIDLYNEHHITTLIQPAFVKGPAQTAAQASGSGFNAGG
jgi:hypothetical protein